MSYPEGHPRHCSLCRKRAVEEALKRFSADNHELLAALNDEPTPRRKAEGGEDGE